jgi:hypothetical protein
MTRAARASDPARAPAARSAEAVDVAGPASTSKLVCEAVLCPNIGAVEPSPRRPARATAAERVGRGLPF